MTASSIDIFPCRVQLMGLPPSSSNNFVAKNNFVRPSIAKIQGISRNLFGSPDRDEMKILYQQEAERVHSYVRQRYNFDTKNLKPINEKEHKKRSTDKIRTSQPAITCEMQPTYPISTTQQEFAHEHWLGGGYYAKRADVESTQVRKPVFSNEPFSKINQRFNELSSFRSAVVEPQKRYRKQSLIKESFNIRKNRVCVTKSNQHSNPKEIILETSKNSHRNPDILRLPKSVQPMICDIQDKGNELPTFTNFVSQQQAETEESKSRTIGYGDNSTTLSLQHIVPTPNTSP